MKNLAYIIFIVFAFASCAQNEVVITEKQIPENVFYLKGQLKPFTGKCLIYYPNTDVVKEELNYKKGRLNGMVISYYANGKVKRIGEYRKGHFHGNWEYWGDQGKKIYEVSYQNDTLSGKYTTWYANGQLCEKGEYKNNRKSGTWLVYDQFGKLVNKQAFETN